VSDIISTIAKTMLFWRVAALTTLLVLHGIGGVLSLSQDASSRRTFLKRAPAVASVSAACFFLNLDEDESSSRPEIRFQAPVAAAFERRDVGDKDRSALTAAYNIQAYKTNSRLEQSGFKLDTREEEQAKLSNALGSFSYESSITNKNTRYSSNKGSKSK
jgi:hypothetical protein